MDEIENRGRGSTERWSDPEDPAASEEPETNQRRARSEWHPPKGLLLLLIAVVALCIFILAYLRDESAPWDEDLRRPVFIQQQQDMSAPARMKTMLVAAAKVNTSDPAALAPWTADIAKTAALLDRHGPVLDNFRDLLEEKPEEWEPRSLLWKVDNFASDPAWPAVMMIKEAECAHLARRGQEELAFLCACDLLVLASLLERIDAWPNFMDRAMELQERGTQLLARLLSRTQLGEEKLRRLQEDEFNQWQPKVETLRAAMDGFYSFERKLLLGPDGDEPPLPLWYLPARSGSRIFFKPNATLRLFAESFRELKNESNRSAFSRANQIESRLLSRGLSGGANRSGEDYFAARIPGYASLLDRFSLARTRHGMVLTLFGIRRYVQKESRLPAKLEDLAPRYLSAVPLDNFSGEPLRYDAKRGLIWSVGTNFKDEGGRPTEIPMSDSEEPTIEIGIGLARKGS
jgi:hypothetical protein